MALGNYNEALQALKIRRDSDHLIRWEEWSKQRKRSLKSGWKYIGHGGARIAFLSPTGVVYKINHKHDALAPDDDNYTEWVNHKKIKLPPGFAFPKSRMFNPKGEHVLAVEYIGGRRLSPAQVEKVEQILTDAGVEYYDCHEDNVKCYKGVRYILDYTH